MTTNVSLGMHVGMALVSMWRVVLSVLVQRVLPQDQTKFVKMLTSVENGVINVLSVVIIHWALTSVLVHTAMFWHRMVVTVLIWMNVLLLLTTASLCVKI